MAGTLYISDLDGTLLTSGQNVSRESLEIINGLTDKGMMFSYATARSIITARKVTDGLKTKYPVIVNNGAFIIDSTTGERHVKNVFTHDEAEEIYALLSEHGISPLIYSMMGSEEKFSYVPEKLTRGMKDFLDTRKDDPRHRPSSGKDMLQGEMFYFSCIDDAGTMSKAYNELKEHFHCIYGLDIYSGDQWLEILPVKANKANAVLQLKEYLGADKLVVFGDGINDTEMFRAADECYAVENASPELKALADGVIGGNNDNSVAKFLLEKFSENDLQKIHKNL